MPCFRNSYPTSLNMSCDYLLEAHHLNNSQTIEYATCTAVTHVQFHDIKQHKRWPSSIYITAVVITIILTKSEQTLRKFQTTDSCYTLLGPCWQNRNDIYCEQYFLLKGLQVEELRNLAKFTPQHFVFIVGPTKAQSNDEREQRRPPLEAADVALRKAKDLQYLHCFS